jgi:hypothetical protein
MLHQFSGPQPDYMLEFLEYQIQISRHEPGQTAGLRSLIPVGPAGTAAICFSRPNLIANDNPKLSSSSRPKIRWPDQGGQPCRRRVKQRFSRLMDRR